MRTVGGFALTVLIGVLTAGCDSDQPLQLGRSNATLSFKATGGQGLGFNVFEVFEDANGDGEPDDLDDDGSGDSGLWCQATLNQAGTAFLTTGLSNAPWYYSLEISVIRAGTTSAVVLTPPTALNVGLNRTGYDAAVSPAGGMNALPVIYDDGRCSLNLDIKCNATPGTASRICENNASGVCGAPGTCSGNPAIACDTTGTGPAICTTSGAGSCVAQPRTVQRNFLFRNPMILSAANRSLIQSKGNPVSALVPETYGGTAGTFLGAPSFQNAVRFSVCPGTDIGDPVLVGQDPPFELSLDKGDTLIVKFGRFDRVDPPALTFTTEPNIEASLTIDGVEVESTQLQGDVSTNASKPAVSFSYTAR